MTVILYQCIKAFQKHWVDIYTTLLKFNMHKTFVVYNAPAPSTPPPFPNVLQDAVIFWNNADLSSAVNYYS